MCFSSRKPKRARLVKREHLIGKTEYFCSSCKAPCNKGDRFCKACGARFASLKYDPEWMDELADSE